MFLNASLLDGASALCYDQAGDFRLMSAIPLLDLNLLIEPMFRSGLDSDLIRETVLKALMIGDISYSVEVGVTVTDDETVAALNRKYRGKEGTTDVLSFSMADEEEEDTGFISPPNSTFDMGDVIISYPQALRQVATLDHGVEDEIIFLVVHGMFHLMGYDHEDCYEAKSMEYMETETLKLLNIDRKNLFSGKQ